MNYLGGKERIATWIKRELVARRRYESHYLEPFVGSGATFFEIAPYFSKATAADLHVDLALMWQAVADGWIPPKDVDRQTYNSLRNQAPSALRGFVGFGCSFGGKWFGGYAKGAVENYALTAHNSVMAKSDIFRQSTIIHADYRRHSPGAGTVVYCDPPYADTTGYLGEVFDSDRFWAVATEWAQNGADVFVSEAKAPAPWKAVATMTRNDALRNWRRQKRIESIFCYRP